MTTPPKKVQDSKNSEKNEHSKHGKDATKNKDAEKAKDPPPISMMKLFRYATKLDVFLMVIGTFTSLGTGVIFPVFSLVLGNFTTDISPINPVDSLATAASNNGIKFIIVGIGAFFAQLFTYCCWVITGARQSKRYRTEYFKAMLRQPIAYFDSSNPNEFASRMASETDLIEKGISEKIAEISYGISTIVTGFTLGFVKGWELSALLLATIPVLAIAAVIFAKSIQKQSTQSVEIYAKSGGSAEQALGAMRTVASLTGEPRELSAYEKGTKVIRKAMIYFIAQSGFSFGLFFFANRATYALGFWFGSKLIEWGRINSVTGLPWSVGDVLTVFFTVSMASSSLGFIAPSLKAVFEARSAAARVQQVIDKKIDYSYQETNKGITKESIDGEVEFKEAEFCYPARPGIKVLNAMSFKILKNKKNALVGESGCGKSTCMQLIERFYDVDSGSIEIDGKNIKEYNLSWLRQNIGYVGQEPVLFSRSIKENLLMAKPNATEPEMWDALRQANAEEFVRGFKEGLDTFVGSSGAALSGGQKQRIAIARIILKNPSILLLDEATSALDRKNELEIQETLDKIAKGRTSIVIAHRLTTIQNADRIFVFEKGCIVEQGTHDELISKGQLYFNLQKGQLATGKKAENGNEIKPETKHDNYTDIPLKKPDDGKENEHEHVKQPHSPVEVDPKSPAENNPKSPAKDPTKDPAKEDPFEGMSAAEKKKLQRSLTKRLYELNKPERCTYFIGVILCLLDGCIMPLFGLLLARTVKTIAVPSDPDFRRDANLYALMFFILGLVSIFTFGLKQTFLGAAGEGLTERIRAKTFDKMMRMHIGWFDDPKNLPGILTTRLAVDAQTVNTLTTTSQAAVYQAFSAISTGLAVSFSASWQLALVALGAIPFFIIVAVITGRNAMKDIEKTTAIQKEAGQYLSEALCNIRTVAGLCAEGNFLGLYTGLSETTRKTLQSKGVKLGVSVGLIQLCLFGYFALLFYAGTMFISRGWIDFVDLFQSIFGIIYAAFELIFLGKAASDIGKGLGAAGSLFKILDTKSQIDWFEQTGPKDKTPFKGEIEFINVKFKYPTRAKQIFNGLNFKINANSKVALVGPSGCGKSTIMQLLLRFYDVEEGQILIDGKNIKDYDIHHLRKSFGLVSQEPFLFNGTVEENIKYCKENAQMEELRKAAADANALGFIEANDFEVGQNQEEDAKMGAGWQKKVGSKGSQISGGQKQRIAIARALIKDPSVLLLDEATSALDSQSEKIVQESLNKILKETNRTSITIAHRISTIKDSDEILVFENGAIVERGNYDQLQNAQGVFYRLERGM